MRMPVGMFMRLSSNIRLKIVSKIAGIYEMSIKYKYFTGLPWEEMSKAKIH